ncbi:ArsC/Spx/MgsR family protein [Bacillus sp. B15-48]|uniref:ArsC/Spx/MgsR family protein n=1 Tax=Bacillus sp. B15-48 TaxID=1548601 RepID=UPI00193F2CFA|nr:ArsC/Spx/MgsR family protein [Bacillus sp. B15-48]
MDQWILYGKSGNPSSDIAKAWLKNNGIPFESLSVYDLTREEIVRLANLMPGGAKNLVYPDVFSFSMINPQRHTERPYIEKIHSGELSEEEICDLVAEMPSLVITPVITNQQSILIGYDLDTLVSTFRNVKVKDVTSA